MSAPAPELSAPLRRALWRCRRGMKELDLILERYARGPLAAASAQDQASFACLLELPDPLLADYLLGGHTPRRPLWPAWWGRSGLMSPEGPGRAILSGITPDRTMLNFHFALQSIERAAWRPSLRE